MPTPPDRRAPVRGMGQDLVNWLWAFFFWIAGLSSTLNAATSPLPQKWPAVLARTVMLSVGGAALILCSLTIWRELLLEYRRTRPAAEPRQAG